MKIWELMEIEFAYRRWGFNAGAQYYWWIGEAALYWKRPGKQSWAISNATGWASRK